MLFFPLVIILMKITKIVTKSLLCIKFYYFLFSGFPNIIIIVENNIETEVLFSTREKQQHVLVAYKMNKSDWKIDDKIGAMSLSVFFYLL